MQLSIAGYSFHGLRSRGMMDVFGYLETCRYRYGLDTADIWAGLLGSDAEQFLRDAYIANVAEAIKQRELRLVNYHADGCHVWEDDPAARDRNAVLAERHISAAEKLGAKTIRIDPGGRERHWSAEAFDCVVARYRAWAKRAADNGYRIGPERHWGAGNHVDNLLQLVAAVDSPGFGILLHMGKDADGDPAEADRALAPHAMHVHLVETVIDQHLDASLQILREANYNAAIAVELQAGEDEYEQVARGLYAIKTSRVFFERHGRKRGHSDYSGDIASTTWMRDE